MEERLRAIVRQIALAIILIALGSRGVVAQQSGPEAVSTWLHSSPSHRAYLSVESDLVEIFREGDSRSLPRQLLIDRLNLAAARRVAPPLLVSGMRRELERLKVGAEIVDATFMTVDRPSDRARSDRTELINNVSIYLAGGLSRWLLEHFLTDSLRSQISAEAIFKACAATLRLTAGQKQSDPRLLAYAQALVGSRVPPAGYGAISSFVIRAWSMGSNGEDLVASTIRILRQGGGLPQLELQLGRRR